VNLQEAYDMIDLLLDKADQPYFTDDEKNKFLDQAIMAFINHHYEFYDQEQISRDALMFFLHWESITSADNTDEETVWNGYSQELHPDYVHLIHFRLTPTINDEGNYDTADMDSYKIVGAKDFWDHEYSSDPFNKPSDHNKYCYVRHGISNGQAKVYFRPTSDTGYSQALQLVYRNREDVFSDNENERVKEIYQREILDLAVRKMVVNIESMNIQSQSVETEQSKSI